MLNNPQKGLKLTDRLEFKALMAHRENFRGDRILSGLFQNDDNRFDTYHIQINGLLFDYSKHLIDDQGREYLCDLARACDVEGQRDSMFRGAAINTTENRAVLHTALRGSVDKDVYVDGVNVCDFLTNLNSQMQRMIADIRGDETITDVVTIGIGGSAIGPHMVTRALRPFLDGPRLHFVSNIDGADLSQVLMTLNPRSTVFIVSSKTFTTLETIENAKIARAWSDGHSRFIAVTGNKHAAEQFGVAANDILPLPDWIGGRYSVWSGIGLPVAIGIGFDQFQNFLRGARDIDTHFKSAPLHKNIPVMMALLGVWYRNVWGYNTHAVLPYVHNLEIFPRYIRQIDMESNGKHVDRNGQRVHYPTGPIIIGGCGTSAQHAFFQLLHQGHDIVPCDFIASIHPQYDVNDHHTHLLSNMFAQSRALMCGSDSPEAPHRGFDGDRPSSTILVDRLDPYHLGALMAIYEHKLFVQGAIWNINSFDQWGVELGKVIARDVFSAMTSGDQTDRYDSSTQGLMRAVKIDPN